jgi:threonine/homoserine/homoserine lactone efflux protein
VAFSIITYVGAAYLVLVGIQGLLGAFAGGDKPPARGPSGSRPWRQGLLSNLGNPKMAVFFSGLLPQFAESFAGLLAFGLLFCAGGRDGRRAPSPRLVRLVAVVRPLAGKIARTAGDR